MVAVGLWLSEDKTLITHIDEGLDFLGWRIQRHQKQAASRHPMIRDEHFTIMAKFGAEYRGYIQ